MSGKTFSSRALILIKALPQPSKTYGETVCCAGVTELRQWKRLFPIRFRHLSGQASFNRWNWVRFKYGNPRHDNRLESCHVHEESLRVDGTLPVRERSRFLNPLVVSSAIQATTLGQSLALIRPKNTRFIAKPRARSKIDSQRDAFHRAARQFDLFDKQLADIEPSPYEFRFKFEDSAGMHNYECGDWETHAMFWRWSNESNTRDALDKMDHIYNVEYPRKGMVFGIGNQAKRPHVWQLLGVIRLDELKQTELF